MTGDYLNKILSINAEDALYRKEDYWYHNLNKFPGVLFNQNGYVLFPDEDSYGNNPKRRITKDLHVTGNINSLPGYREFTYIERALIKRIDLNTIQEKEVEETIRVQRQKEVVLWNKDFVVQLKKLYDNTCHICGTKLSVGPDIYYSEIHHIISLGRHLMAKTFYQIGYSCARIIMSIWI